MVTIGDFYEENISKQKSSRRVGECVPSNVSATRRVLDSSFLWILVDLALGSSNARFPFVQQQQKRCSSISLVCWRIPLPRLTQRDPLPLSPNPPPRHSPAFEPHERAPHSPIPYPSETHRPSLPLPLPNLSRRARPPIGHNRSDHGGGKSDDRRRSSPLRCRRPGTGRFPSRHDCVCFQTQNERSWISGTIAGYGGEEERVKTKQRVGVQG